ncbi:unnamed protein product [Paramecium sonneborni]|uniref:Ubiquitin-like domain-containing protein n=1 Tax=Paramecium sonneborni TaxID=65129 RepID=A0A8S1RDP0_9CILI|nr:unnamed protein product [Paramecium sonneborni]
MNQLIVVIITWSQKNKIYNIEIDPKTMVSDLQKELAEMFENIIPEQITLNYAGEILQPKETLEQKNIKKGAQIEMLIQRLGGF